MMIEIILASESPRRKQILEQLGLTFQVQAPDVDETISEEITPSDAALKLAVRKAMKIARNTTVPALVIGCDTIVSMDGNVYGKPADKDQAKKMLTHLRGTTHEVISGLSVIRTNGNGQTHVCGTTETTRVSFVDFSDQFLEWYINTGEPMDKAGAYGIQGQGALLTKSIEGCYFNVMGLPVQALATLFDMQGYRIVNLINGG